MKKKQKFVIRNRNNKALIIFDETLETEILAPEMKKERRSSRI